MSEKLQTYDSPEQQIAVFGFGRYVEATRDHAASQTSEGLYLMINALCSDEYAVDRAGMRTRYIEGGPRRIELSASSDSKTPITFRHLPPAIAVIHDLHYTEVFQKPKRLALGKYAITESLLIDEHGQANIARCIIPRYVLGRHQTLSATKVASQSEASWAVEHLFDAAVRDYDIKPRHN